MQPAGHTAPIEDDHENEQESATEPATAGPQPQTRTSAGLGGMAAALCVDAIVSLDTDDSPRDPPAPIVEGTPSMPTVFVDDAAAMGEATMEATVRNIRWAFYQAHAILGILLSHVHAAARGRRDRPRTRQGREHRRRECAYRMHPHQYALHQHAHPTPLRRGAEAALCQQKGALFAHSTASIGERRQIAISMVLSALTWGSVLATIGRDSAIHPGIAKRNTQTSGYACTLELFGTPMSVIARIRAGHSPLVLGR